MLPGLFFAWRELEGSAEVYSVSTLPAPHLHGLNANLTWGVNTGFKFKHVGRSFCEASVPEGAWRMCLRAAWLVGFQVCKSWGLGQACRSLISKPRPQFMYRVAGCRVLIAPSPRNHCFADIRMLEKTYEPQPQMPTHNCTQQPPSGTHHHHVHHDAGGF